jgi:hypothetical protein
MDLYQSLQDFRHKQQSRKEYQAHQEWLQMLKDELPVYQPARIGKVRTHAFWKKEFPYEKAFDKCYVMNHYDEKLQIRMSENQKEQVRKALISSWQKDWEQGRRPPQFYSSIDEVWILNDEKDLQSYLDALQLNRFSENIDFFEIIREAICTARADNNQLITQFSFSTIFKKEQIPILPSAYLNEDGTELKRVLIINNAVENKQLLKIKQSQIQQARAVSEQEEVLSEDYGMIKAKQKNIEMEEQGNDEVVFLVPVPLSDNTLKLIVNKEDTREDENHLYIRIRKNTSCLVRKEDEVDFMSFEDLTEMKERSAGKFYQHFKDETKNYSKIFIATPKEEVPLSLDTAMLADLKKGRIRIPSERILEFIPTQKETLVNLKSADDSNTSLAVPSDLLTKEENGDWLLVLPKEPELLLDRIYYSSSSQENGIQWQKETKIDGLLKKLAGEDVQDLLLIPSTKLIQEADERIYLRIYHRGKYRKVRIEPDWIRKITKTYSTITVAPFQKVWIVDERIENTEQVYAWNLIEGYEEAQKDYFDPEIRYHSDEDMELVYGD